MVFIAGKHIETINAFSSSFLAILSLIVNGYEWLKWAIDDPSLSMFHAKSEQDLLVKIQTGLHDTPILRSDAFTIHIEKAISIDDSDLPLLIKVFSASEDQTAIVETFRSRYNLISNDKLSSNNQFLTDNKLSTNSLFQYLNLIELAI